MEQTKKANYYLIGAAGLAAITMAFMVMRGREDDDLPFEDENEAPASQPAATAAPRVLPKDVRFKVPVSNLQPSEGPSDALVTMVEWCDMRGQACRESDEVLEQLMKEYDGKLRRVYRLVPDTTRPEESKAIHQLARAAYEDNRKSSNDFLAVRKAILAIPDDKPVTESELRPIAKTANLDYETVAQKIRADNYMMTISLDGGLGVRFGVRQLPAVYVNGRPAEIGNAGQHLKSSLKALIDDELVNAQKLLDQGVARADLYETIVEPGLWSLDDNPATRQASAGPTTRPRLHLGGSSPGKQ